jgi:hypothetical protein
MVRRGLALVTAMFVMVVGSIAWAVAAPGVAFAGPVEKAPGGLCSTEEWQSNFKACVSRLSDEFGDRTQCVKPPTPNTPDSGLAGWFAERPASSDGLGYDGYYSKYGYAGYNYTTFDLDGGCAATLTDPDTKIETTIANGEFMIATAIIGASNALRERAWDPSTLWGWADTLVDQATRAVYEKVFTVFGVITLGIVGLYLIWRSRQAELGAATTTAGWALLIMVVVTAIAAWPVRSANIADQSLITGLSAVHGAVGPREQGVPPGQCDDPTPGACDDDRAPAVRASDTATDTILYRNFLRGFLGSADSETAKKYGLALYDAKSISWQEAEKLRANPQTRDALIDQKNKQWELVALQIQREDPEAYEYLRGVNGMERVGAGFIAMLAAFLFAMFDLTASLLVLLGFLIFRWAVIAAPILGTIGLLRPASAGIRRLGNAVVAAVFNIAIFGTGAAIYLFAVDLIMNTPSLAGWLQVVLVWLCGVVGWLLLRPYRRITQLGGKDSAAAIASAGSWHRRFFRDMREAAKLEVAEVGGTSQPTFGKDGRPIYVEQRGLRPEARLEDPTQLATSRTETASGDASTAVAIRPDGTESARDDVSAVGAQQPRKLPAATPTRARSTSEWTEPDIAERPTSYAIYRPETGSTAEEPASPRVRSEAR